VDRSSRGAARAALPSLEPEEQAGDSEGDQPRRGPDQAVGEEGPAQIGQPGVGLERRVVADGLAQGDAAEGIQPGGDLPHLLLVGQGPHDDPEDQQGRGADVGGHHRTGRRRQGEEEGRGQEDGGQGQGPIGVDVDAQPVGSERLRI
jgi:hypothetical protein